MKIVAISDTHGLHHRMVHPVPEGDVLVVAWDFTSHGRREETLAFLEWMAAHPHPHKILVAGNHNLDMEIEPLPDELLEKLGIVYLEDEELVIDGVKFYGSPWTPNYYNWAFMMERNSAGLAQKWADIPDDTDILITHGPPAGILDGAWDWKKSGCELLAERVKQLNLKAHIFGHIHEAHGTQGIFHNVAICDIDYEPVNKPTVIEVK